MDSKLIYIADDEERICDLIKSYLEKDGFSTVCYNDGKSALDAFVSKPADMMIIDVTMPILDGYSLCREIRKLSEIPIIMVSARDEEIDRILGLELGSDDYISKPFSPRELVIRVKNIFKRLHPNNNSANSSNDEIISCKDITLNITQRTVQCHQKNIDLTAKEYELFCFLFQNINHPFSRGQMIERIWGYDYIGETRTIDDLVKRLRKKICEAGSIVEISTVWGFGYKISDND